MAGHHSVGRLAGTLATAGGRDGAGIQRADMLVAMRVGISTVLDDSAAARRGRWKRPWRLDSRSNPRGFAAAGGASMVSAAIGHARRPISRRVSHSDALARFSLLSTLRRSIATGSTIWMAPPSSTAPCSMSYPGHPQATAVMAEIEWGRKIGLPHCLYSSHWPRQPNRAWNPGRLWQRAGWSAQMTGDVERARSTTARLRG